MKKALLPLLICLSLVFCVCCAATEEPETIPEFETEYTIDLNGLSFIHGSEWNHELCDEVGYSSAGDKVHAQIAKLKETYGCTYEIVKWEDGSTRILSEIAAGIDTADVLDSHADAGGYALYKAGALYALEDIPGIDWDDEKWGTKSFLQYGKFDGKNYGFYQYAWEFMPEYAGVLLFNGELLLKMGLAYPYELQENGQWTWANFRTMLETIQTTSSSYEDKIVPFSSTSIAFDAQGFMFSNGCVIAEQDSTGKYVSKIDDDKAYAALEFLAGLYKDKLYTTDGIGKFNDSLAVFVGCETYYATHHYSSANYPVSFMTDLGFIQCPYGPNGSPDLVTGFIQAHRRLNWITNANSKGVEEIGIVLDFMFSPLDDAGGWKSYAEGQIFHHQQGYDNYARQLENINYNYSIQAPIIKTTGAFSEVITGRKTAKEALESLSMNIQAALDENMNK